MITLDYPQIQKEVFQDLPPRTQEVLRRRFGLENQKKETLESIGQGFQVTRERVRQVEKVGLDKLRDKGLGKIQPVVENFSRYLKSQGNLKRENSLLEEIGGEQYKPYVRFFLVLAPNFYRVRETEFFYPFWTLEPEQATEVETTLQLLLKRLEELNHPLSLEEILALDLPYNKSFILSCLEAAKRIEPNWQKAYGLTDWPEINPRRLRDKIYLVLKEGKHPLHFSQVTNLVNEFGQKITFPVFKKPALTQTVHNELIRDERFVLVGRGIYALSQWGYEPGTVKDVIIKILRQSGKPLSREEIIAQALKQRMVEETTILLNLSREKTFERCPDGRYRLVQ